jgi:hypothetical protein
LQIPGGLPPGVQAPGGLLSRMNAGAYGMLGRLGSSMFGVPAGLEGMPPELIRQQQQQALLQLGLGMLAGKERGMGFGQSTLAGLSNAQSGFQDILQQSYRNTLLNREAARADTRDQRDEDRWRADRDYQMQRDRQSDERWRAEQDLRMRATEADIRGQGVLANQRAQEAAAAEQARARVQELTKKPTLTEAERLELEVLTGGAPSNLIRAQTGLGMFGGMGMFPPGLGMPAADPLSALPDPPGFGAQGGATGSY